MFTMKELELILSILKKENNYYETLSIITSDDKPELKKTYDEKRSEISKIIEKIDSITLKLE